MGWTVTGERGELRVGYQWAATITQWNLTCNQVSLASVDSILRSRVESADLYWSTQLPMRIRLWMGNAWWVWERVHILTPLRKGEIVEIKLEGDPIAISE